MKLDPERYECAEHQVDLTGLVQDELDDDDRPPVAYQGSLRSLLGGRRAGPRPFRVVVKCPGAEGASEHSLTFTGTRAP